MTGKNFRNLVFEGGGVKGIAYGGALSVLQDLEIIDNILRVGGTSAGAINATLLALGYSIKDVSQIIATTNFSSFADGGSIFSKIPRLWRKFGINKGDAFSSFLREKIRDRSGNPDFTFRQLAESVKEKIPGYKYLYVIGTDLSGQKPMIFSHEANHNPDTPIWKAVRISMSIPLYFQAIRFGNSIMVDGGVTYNYPVDIFDHKKYLSNDVNGDSAFYKDEGDFVFNYETLGFRLDSQEVIKYSHHNWSIPPQKITGIKDYFSALLNFMMEMANKKHLVQEDWNRTIFINTLDVKTIDFNISPEKIIDLTQSGEKCAKKYFEWKDRDQHWSKYPV
jgi:NTE family protein